MTTATTAAAMTAMGATTAGSTGSGEGLGPKAMGYHDYGKQSGPAYEVPPHLRQTDSGSESTRTPATTTATAAAAAAASGAAPLFSTQRDASSSLPLPSRPDVTHSKSDLVLTSPFQPAPQPLEASSLLAPVPETAHSMATTTTSPIPTPMLHSRAANCSMSSPPVNSPIRSHMSPTLSSGTLSPSSGKYLGSQNIDRSISALKSRILQLRSMEASAASGNRDTDEEREGSEEDESVESVPDGEERRGKGVVEEGGARGRNEGSLRCSMGETASSVEPNRRLDTSVCSPQELDHHHQQPQFERTGLVEAPPPQQTQSPPPPPPPHEMQNHDHNYTQRPPGSFSDSPALPTARIPPSHISRVIPPGTRLDGTRSHVEGASTQTHFPASNQATPDDSPRPGSNPTTPLVEADVPRAPPSPLFLPPQGERQSTNAASLLNSSPSSGTHPEEDGSSPFTARSAATNATEAIVTRAWQLDCDEIDGTSQLKDRAAETPLPAQVQPSEPDPYNNLLPQVAESCAPPDVIPESSQGCGPINDENPGLITSQDCHEPPESKHTSEPPACHFDSTGECPVVSSSHEPFPEPSLESRNPLEPQNPRDTISPAHQTSLAVFDTDDVSKTAPNRPCGPRLPESATEEWDTLPGPDSDAQMDASDMTAPETSTGRPGTSPPVASVPALATSLPGAPVSPGEILASNESSAGANLLPVENGDAIVGPRVTEEATAVVAGRLPEEASNVIESRVTKFHQAATDVRPCEGAIPLAKPQMGQGAASFGDPSKSEAPFPVPTSLKVHYATSPCELSPPSVQQSPDLVMLSRPQSTASQEMAQTLSDVGRDVTNSVELGPVADITPGPTGARPPEQCEPDLDIEPSANGHRALSDVQKDSAMVFGLSSEYEGETTRAEAQDIPAGTQGTGEEAVDGRALPVTDDQASHEVACRDSNLCPGVSEGDAGAFPGLIEGDTNVASEVPKQVQKEVSEVPDRRIGGLPAEPTQSSAAVLWEPARSGKRPIVISEQEVTSTVGVFNTSEESELAPRRLVSANHDGSKSAKRVIDGYVSTEVTSPVVTQDGEISAGVHRDGDVRSGDSSVGEMVDAERDFPSPGPVSSTVEDMAIAPRHPEMREEHAESAPELKVQLRTLSNLGVSKEDVDPNSTQEEAWCDSELSVGMSALVTPPDEGNESEPSGVSGPPLTPKASSEAEKSEHGLARAGALPESLEPRNPQGGPGDLKRASFSSQLSPPRLPDDNKSYRLRQEEATPRANGLRQESSPVPLPTPSSSPRDNMVTPSAGSPPAAGMIGQSNIELDALSGNSGLPMLLRTKPPSSRTKPVIYAGMSLGPDSGQFSPSKPSSLLLIADGQPSVPPMATHESHDVGSELPLAAEGIHLAQVMSSGPASTATEARKTSILQGWFGGARRSTVQGPSASAVARGGTSPIGTVSKVELDGPHHGKRRDSIRSDTSASTTGSTTASFLARSIANLWSGKGPREVPSENDSAQSRQSSPIPKSLTSEPSAAPEVFKNVKRTSTTDSDWGFWSQAITQTPEWLAKNRNSISKHMHIGVPSKIRGCIWLLLSDSKSPELERMYTTLLKHSSPDERVIRRDVARTFPKHEFFSRSGCPGQEMLFNLLKAYSLYDPEVGYCQGLSFVCGALLLNLPEEEAFSVLVRLMRHNNLRANFTQHMEGLQVQLFVFNRLLQQRLPRLHKHLQAEGVQPAVYASQWIMTFFAYRFPMNLVFRVLDLVFLEGPDVIYKFCISVMKKHRDKLMTLELESLVDFLKNGLFKEYSDDSFSFVTDALAVAINVKDIEKWKTEYGQQVDPGHVLTIENLKHKNSALVLHIKRLESDLADLNRDHCDLANRLVQTQIDSVQLQETNENLMRQVQGLKSVLANDHSERVEERRKEQEEEELSWKTKFLECDAQLKDTEELLIETKVKYAESENKRFQLAKKVDDLSRTQTTGTGGHPGSEVGSKTPNTG